MEKIIKEKAPLGVKEPFFTLLTRTVFTPNRNPDLAEKRQRPGSCLVDVSGHQDENDKAFSRPLLSRSYFNFYINEEDQDQGRPKRDADRSSARDKTSRGLCSSGMDETEEGLEDTGGHRPLGGLAEKTKTDREFLSHFNIPNFVNLDHSSILGEDDLLYEPSAILERQAQAHNSHCETR